MKKKIIIVLAGVLVSTIIGGGAYALTNNNQPLTKNKSISAALANSPETTPTAETQPSQVSPVPQTATPTSEPVTPPTPDQVKADVQQKIKDFILSQSSVDSSSDIVQIQLNCMDKTLAANNIRYDGLNTVMSFVNPYYITGQTNDQGHKYRHYFDNVSCHVITIPVN